MFRSLVFALIASIVLMGCSEKSDEIIEPEEPVRLPGIVIINAALEYVKSDTSEFIQSLDSEKDPDDSCEWSIGQTWNDDFTEVDILITVSAEIKLDCSGDIPLALEGLRSSLKKTYLHVYKFNVNWFAETGKDAITFFSREIIPDAEEKPGILIN